MTDTHDAHLGEHEAMYLAMVGEQLDGLSAGRRAELLAVVADNLDERPPALSWDLLIAELGTPATYAAQLVDGPIRRARRTPKQRLQRRRRWLAGAFIGAVAAGLIAPLVARPLRRMIDPAPEPYLSTNCWGLSNHDPDLQVEHREAAGVHEYRVDFLEGALFRIPVCLGSTEPIEVLEVRPFNMKSGNEFELSEWFPAQPIGQEPKRYSSDTADPPTPDEPVDLRPNTSLDIEQVMRFGACTADPGSVVGVGAVAVTYRYDGSLRTEAVDLGAVYSVSGTGACTHES